MAFDASPRSQQIVPRRPGYTVARWRDRAASPPGGAKAMLLTSSMSIRALALAGSGLAALALLLPACASSHDVEVPADGHEPHEQHAAPPAQAVREAAAPVEAAAKPVPSMAEARRLFEAERYAEAVPLLQAITEREPQNGEAWFRLGYSLHVLGRIEEALPAHTRAAGFPDYRPTALYNVGCANALLGHADAAFTALDGAIDAGFDDRDVMAQDSDLASLHADARWAALLARVGSKSAQGAAR
jgi:tetratricopeptide (TPR) repeat protein